MPHRLDFDVERPFHILYDVTWARLIENPPIIMGIIFMMQGDVRIVPWLSVL